MKDFGIFLIKPDGVKQEISKECENEIKEHSIDIIAKKKCNLSVDNIKRYFYYQLPAYLEYMCSGPVIAYLLSTTNIDIDRELFHVKDLVRRRHLVSGQNLKNLVHASHCGSEYFLQRKLFFQEYEKREYTSYADMIVNLPNCTVETIAKVKKTIKSSYVQKICLHLPFKDFNEHSRFLKKIFYNEVILFLFSVEVKLSYYTCKLYCYCPPNYRIKNSYDALEIVNNRELLIALGEIKPLDFKINVQNIITFSDYVELYNLKIGSVFLEVYNELSKRKINVTGLIVNTANMSLVEAETRYEVMQQLGLAFIGGSNNWTDFGVFGISKTKFNGSIKSFFK